MAGQFAMQVTLASAQMIRPAEEATPDTLALPRKNLVGQPSAIGNMPPVTGAGISGNIWIRAYPPTPR